MYSQWRSEVKWRPWQRKILRPLPLSFTNMYISRRSRAKIFNFYVHKDGDLRGAQNYHLGAQFFTKMLVFFLFPLFCAPLEMAPMAHAIPAIPSLRHCVLYLYVKPQKTRCTKFQLNRQTDTRAW